MASKPSRPQRSQTKLAKADNVQGRRVQGRQRAGAPYRFHRGVRNGNSSHSESHIVKLSDGSVGQILSGDIDLTLGLATDDRVTAFWNKDHGASHGPVKSTATTGPSSASASGRRGPRSGLRTYPSKAEDGQMFGQAKWPQRWRTLRPSLECAARAGGHRHCLLIRCLENCSYRSSSG